MKGQNKNQFLASFTGNKLRKNAKKKIGKLLEFADELTLKTQSMGLDDCFRHNDPITMPKTDFWAWFDKNYSSMVIYLNISDGILTSVEFCDCIYHFSNDVVMTFTLDETKGSDQETKLKVSLAEVERALLEGYISPLNHDKKHLTNSRKVVSLGDFEQRQEAKRDRLEERAANAQERSNEHYQVASSLGKMIPFGQPILVGHHSEARHRKHCEKIDNNMRKKCRRSKKS